MARTRTIKPEFWDDEKLATVSRDARLTFIGIWTHSDDYGVVKGHPSWLKNKIFPYDEIKPADFKRWLEELESKTFVLPFESHGEKFYYIKHFTKHQVINRPSKTRNPEPPQEILSEYSMSAHGGLTDETETETETEIETETESTNSSEMLRAPRRSLVPPLEIPLVGKSNNGPYSVTEEDVAEWTNAFPGIDVIAELRKCQQWNIANPKRRKTERGIKNHIVSWLSRAQDRGGKRGQRERTYPT